MTQFVSVLNRTDIQYLSLLLIAATESARPHDQQREEPIMTTETVFETIIDKYLQDNHGLDPIVKRQIQSWKFEWNEADREVSSPGAVSEAPSSSNHKQLPHSYSGSLIWRSEDSILVVTIYSTCSWSDTLLEWTCRARADFADVPTDKTQKKIYKKLKSRLEKDDYISKLFHSDPLIEQDECTTPHGTILAQASVNTADNGLEERVWTNSDVAEGIRRSIWNSAEEPIDVLEFVIQYLPLLPCVAYTQLQQTTSLADRAVLRLLEDAMCDACDREGEGEVLEDLHIRKKGCSDDD